jgi:ABC-type multidrug transport system fused ATPase/permease subunit
MEPFASDETEVIPISKKKRHGKRKKYIPVKFNKRRFLISLVLGIVFIGLGVLIIWDSKTVPELNPQSLEVSNIQRIMQSIPESVKETIAFVMGNLFLLFGVASIFFGLKLTVKYIAKKLR